MKNPEFIFVVVLAVLLISGIAFADPLPGTGVGSAWFSTVFIAILISVIILALIYMVGHGFGLNDVKVLATEELYQVLATAIMIAVVVAGSSSLDAFSSAIIGDSITLQQAAINMITSPPGSAARTGFLDHHEEIINNIRHFSKFLGNEASKSVFCSLQGMGYNINSCSSYGALRSSLALASQSVSIAITELNSLNTLLKFGQDYAFALLLPAGILLRTFKFTRPAGGLFIGLAVSIYFFVPLSVLVTGAVLEGYHSSMASPYVLSEISTDIVSGTPPVSVSLACEPAGTGLSLSPDFLQNYHNARVLFRENLKPQLDAYAYYSLIEGTLTTIVALIAMFGSLKFVSKLAGVDVDISSLMRLA